MKNIISRKVLVALGFVFLILSASTFIWNMNYKKMPVGYWRDIFSDVAVFAGGFLFLILAIVAFAFAISSALNKELMDAIRRIRKKPTDSFLTIWLVLTFVAMPTLETQGKIFTWPGVNTSVSGKSVPVDVTVVKNTLQWSAMSEKRANAATPSSTAPTNSVFSLATAMTADSTNAVILTSIFDHPVTRMIDAELFQFYTNSCGEFFIKASDGNNYKILNDLGENMMLKGDDGTVYTLSGPGKKNLLACILIVAAIVLVAVIVYYAVKCITRIMSNYDRQMSNVDVSLPPPPPTLAMLRCEAPAIMSENDIILPDTSGTYVASNLDSQEKIFDVSTNNWRDWLGNKVECIHAVAVGPRDAYRIDTNNFSHILEPQVTTNIYDNSARSVDEEPVVTMNWIASDSYGRQASMTSVAKRGNVYFQTNWYTFSYSPESVKMNLIYSRKRHPTDPTTRPMFWRIRTTSSP